VSAVFLSWTAAAGETILLTFLTVVLQGLWRLNDAETATIFTSAIIREALECVILTPLADRYGRRPLFLGCSSLIAVFGIVSHSANDYAVLITTRVIVGFGVGMFFDRTS
jgi:MFS family permease